MAELPTDQAAGIQLSADQFVKQVLEAKMTGLQAYSLIMKTLLAAALEKNSNNVDWTAQTLAVSRPTLYEWLKKFKVRRKGVGKYRKRTDTRLT